MVQYIFLSIALLALFNLLLINIHEIITYYYDHFYPAHNRRKPAHKSCHTAAPGVEIGGLRYNVEWLIDEGRYLYNEEKEIK